jgi:hypothetical protein
MAKTAILSGPPLTTTCILRSASTAYAANMCRSIKTLRPPYADVVTDDDMRAAALQYVRKISGFRAPAARNAAAFEAAVDEVAAATARLLDSLQVRSPVNPTVS